jgi:Biotin-lipoyl like/HlyD family secretion protein
VQETQSVSKEQVYIHLNMRAIDARKANDLQFIITNETIQLVPYRQAAFFNTSVSGKPLLTTASGLVSVAENSPYTVWLNSFAKTFNQTAQYELFNFSSAPAAFQEEWQEWLPEHLLSIPLRDQNQQVIGIVLYARETAWSELEISQLLHLHSVYAYCLSALKHHKKSFSQRIASVFKMQYWMIGFAAFALMMLIPVRLSTLAPAEVIALNAFSVAAPQDGVIQAFMVEPNAPVKKGDLLFTLDDTSVSNRYEVAQKALEIAKADALVAQQRAFDDIRGKADLASAIGKVREKEAELASIQAQMARVEIRAERDGIAIFTDANDWIGRPVQTGERVIQIANPKDAGLLMWLPVKDALNIDKGAPMKLFLHTDPLHPIAAKLNQTSYQSTLSPDNVASYRLKGEFEDKQHLPRIGLRGTARISGEWSILGYYLFRRPIAALREWSGL